MQPKDEGGRLEDTLTATTHLLAESKPVGAAGYAGHRSITELLKSGILVEEKIALVGFRTTDIQPDALHLYDVRAELNDEINKIADRLVTVGIRRLGLLNKASVSTAAPNAAIKNSPNEASS